MRAGPGLIRDLLPLLWPLRGLALNPFQMSDLGIPVGPPGRFLSKQETLVPCHPAGLEVIASLTGPRTAGGPPSALIRPSRSPTTLETDWPYRGYCNNYGSKGVVGIPWVGTLVIWCFSEWPVKSELRISTPWLGCPRF